MGDVFRYNIELQHHCARQFSCICCISTLLETHKGSIILLLDSIVSKDYMYVVGYISWGFVYLLGHRDTSQLVRKQAGTNLQHRSY